MSTMYLAIVPKRSQSLIVIRMEMRQEMMKSVLRERLTEVEIINHYVGVCYESSHFNITL